MVDPSAIVNEPVSFIETDDPARPLDPGMALCLSGGGYRAMLFHVGSLWRLYELNLLDRVKRISSVSGGSITAAMLGLRWKTLSFDANEVRQDFVPQVVAPIRVLAGRTLDASSIIGGILLPGTISDKIAAAYAKHLYGDATLQDLPDAPAS
jgi:NTE family protein